MPHEVERVPVRQPESPADFPRARRWALPAVLELLAEATGTRLAGDGPCAGGQIGASYVRWADGHRSVLTCQPAGRLAAAREAATLIAAARATGVPGPRYELTAELPGVTVIVQELLPGSPPGPRISRATVESMAGITGRLRGLLAGREDLQAPPLYLLSDGPGYCLHGPMARYDRRTARLLAAVEEAGAALPADLAGADLAHFDFHPGNVLVGSSGTVTGVVDWDGTCRSDGTLDLMTLRFDLARRAPLLGRWVGGLLREQADAATELACWAHMTLRLVDWAIREHTAGEVAAWLDAADALRPA